LERDPNREIVGVIKVDDHRPDQIWSELDEYVATDEVHSYFDRILRSYTSTESSPGEDVCIWISGFFGSGKSHFLKVLGYLLENSKVPSPDGTIVGSSSFLCAKLGLTEFEPQLTKLRSKVLLVNLLEEATLASGYSISRIIYRDFLKSKGLSKIFWEAAWEEELQAQGVWEQFLTWVKEQYGRPWEAERQLHSVRVLTCALPHFLPRHYPDEASATKAIEDSRQRHTTIRPKDVAERLRREAEEIHPDSGRLVVLLDEVGLYIGDNTDRLTDLNRVAEQIAVESQGKVWLVATAQETLVDLVPRLTRDRHVLSWLQDRFRVHLQLTPSNIEQVVSERLLKKRPESRSFLDRLYQEKAGSLLAGATLQGVPSGRLNTDISQEDFARFYPLLPQYILLLQAIFSGLRQQSGGSDESRRRLAGRERSMLNTVHAVLRGEGGLEPFADKAIGELVTFDRLYDAISTELSVIKSDHHNAITRRVAEVTTDGLKAVKVAQALFLLQQVGEWLPTTLDNIAAVLYADVDQDVHSHRDRVEATLEALKREGWVREEEGQYKFLSQDEHDFERKVRENTPTPVQKTDQAVDLASGLLRTYRFLLGDKARTPQDVNIIVDDRVIKGTGDLRLYLYTPLANKTKDALLEDSLVDPESIFLLAASDSEFEPVLERTIAIEKTVPSSLTSVAAEQRAYLQRLKGEADNNKDVRLPHLLQRAFMRGTAFIAGAETTFSRDNSLPTALNSLLGPLAAQIYTGFLDVVVQDADCAKILNWRVGVELPSAYTELGLVVGAGIRAESQAAALVLSELKRREQLGEERAGRALVEHFARRPYGWGHQLLRLVMATLFKNGNVVCTAQGKDVHDSDDPLARNVFAGFRAFCDTVFTPLPEVDWRQARDILIELAPGEPVGTTFEQVAAKAKDVAAFWQEKGAALATRAEDLQLNDSFVRSCRVFAFIGAEIAAKEEPNARLRYLLAKVTELKRHYSTFNHLKRFEPNLEGYRVLAEFVRETTSWARELGGDLKQRWTTMEQSLKAADIGDRYNNLRADWSRLRPKYRSDYQEQHHELQQAVRGALEALKQHPAYPEEEKDEKHLIWPLLSLQCDREDLPDAALVCPSCRRRFGELEPARVERVKLQLISDLDKRLQEIHDPGTGGQQQGGSTGTTVRLTPATFARHLEVSSTGELKDLIGELQEYVHQHQGRKLVIKINVVPKGGGA